MTDEYSLNIFNMFPNLLSLYGDFGNLIAVQKRCEWRSIDTNIINYNEDSKESLAEADILLFGGGSDNALKHVNTRLIEHKKEINNLIDDDAVFLLICGAYQLFGNKYITVNNESIEGLAIFDYETVPSEKRFLGNISIENTLNLEPKEIIGFENHSGATYHDYKPLGKVISGFGNNGEDNKEGLVYKNVIGSYLHGPLLPKNHHLTDYLILNALKRKYNIDKLKELNNSLENKALEQVKAKFK